MGHQYRIALAGFLKIVFCPVRRSFVSIYHIEI
jgi:hypothetical protein